MLSVLLKKQLTEIFRNYFYNPKTNKARSKAAVAAYIVLFAVLMVVILGGMFTVLSAALCTPLTAAGLDWLYFALMALLATLLGAFGSVFNTYSGLYLAKDNDLLLSMPIPVNTLMASRLLGVYLMGLMYSGVVMLPAVIVYWVATPAPAAAVIGGVLLVFLLSVFVLALSCALGWLVAKISQKLKNKSFITVVLSLAFFGAYYFFYFKAEDLLQELLRSAAVYGARIKGAAYPLYLLGRVGTGDITAMLTVSAVILALFAALWVLLRRSFIRIATATGQSAKRAYRERAAVRRSVSSALLSKELCRFTASPNYMLNCGMGVLLMPLAGFTLLWKGPDIRAALGAALGAEAGAYLSVMLTAALCMLAAMNDMAAPSVSLEGKSLWLMQSLPVEPWQALRAKLRMQVLLTVPPLLLCAVCAAIVYPLGLVRLLVMAVFAASYALLGALAGLTLGVKMPVLTWTDQLMPIKQSAPVMLTLFGGMGYTILLFAGFLLLPGWRLGFAGYAACFAAANLLLCAVLHRWLRKKGAALFAAL